MMLSQTWNTILTKNTNFDALTDGTCIVIFLDSRTMFGPRYWVILSVMLMDVLIGGMSAVLSVLLSFMYVAFPMFRYDRYVRKDSIHKDE